MKLIVEEIEQVQFLTESSEGKKKYIIEGIFLQSEIKNKNGRLYPYRILENEVNRYNEHFIKKNRAVGELSHSVASPLPDPNLISHKINSLYAEGKNFLGRATILDTPKGKIVQALMDGGVQLGVSSKGLGSLIEKNGVKEVGEDFKLTTAADIVFEPSAPEAFVNGIMEGREFVYDKYGNIMETVSESYRKKIKKAKNKKQLEEAKLKVISNFLTRL